MAALGLELDSGTVPFVNQGACLRPLQAARREAILGPVALQTQLRSDASITPLRQKKIAPWLCLHQRYTGDFHLGSFERPALS